VSIVDIGLLLLLLLLLFGLIHVDHHLDEISKKLGIEDKETTGTNNDS
jgi:hypothetical protein